MMEYKVGDFVSVYFQSTDEWLKGRIVSVLPRFNWTNDTWYEVHNVTKEKPFITITRQALRKENGKPANR